MRSFFKNNGLTVALLAMFAGSVIGHFLTGHAVNNQELATHGRAGISLSAYISDDHFLSTLFENWESEFLQMGTYVVLTAYLFQRGSSESSDPDAPPRDEQMSGKHVTAKSPWPVRVGGSARWIYSHSLGLALFAMFVASFVGHWQFSARQAASEALLHGEPPSSTMAYLADPQLWFESFQNWQSEFLSTAVLVVLSIFLREKRSPESKPVGAPHSKTGD